MSQFRYFIQLAYCGTAYHGWQIQPNANSVQETLEKALSTILREEIKVTGAGRTDTGVHASFFVAHFDCGKVINDTEKLAFRLNSFLPQDIAIQKIFEVDEEAHARFGAVERSYKYFVSREKSAFNNDFVARHHAVLDIDKMNEAALKLFNYTDFTSFSKLHTDVKTNNCEVTYAKWEAHGDLMVFTVSADRFLRNMVRAIVGTLFQVGSGKISVDRFAEIIELKDRGLAGTSAPASGLYLVDVVYPKEIDDQFVREDSGFFRFL
ncbi:tRNA pseudouridine(38-40) synthase TruA [Puteibacter caeruleilacunae]|nr:tRNA pseudouridine(38-40) synthase TruA [Puteibacter caeruleilacunae]